jgi:hypothetical protein
MPVKRKAVAFILIAVFAVSAAAWLVYTQVSELQNQISELHAQNDELQDQIGELQNQNSALQDKLDKIYEGPVQIADFKWTSNWGAGPVFPQWGRSFNITLQNMGIMDVEGISVDIKPLSNNTEKWSLTMLYAGKIGYTPFDGKLNASEIRELRGGFVKSLEQTPDLGEKTFLIRVTVNNTISDELTLPYR